MQQLSSRHPVLADREAHVPDIDGTLSPKSCLSTWTLLEPLLMNVLPSSCLVEIHARVLWTPPTNLQYVFISDISARSLNALHMIDCRIVCKACCIAFFSLGLSLFDDQSLVLPRTGDFCSGCVSRTFPHEISGLLVSLMDPAGDVMSKFQSHSQARLCGGCRCQGLGCAERVTSLAQLRACAARGARS